MNRFLCKSVWCAVLAVASVAGAQTTSPSLPPVTLSAADDLKRLCALLNVQPILTRPAYNYDESKANPFPNLPDILTLKNGEKVTTPEMWWKERRPEIVEDFEREVLAYREQNVAAIFVVLGGCHPHRSANRQMTALHHIKKSPVIIFRG